VPFRDAFPIFHTSDLANIDFGILDQMADAAAVVALRLAG
jgi:hypothetical protein